MDEEFDRQFKLVLLGESAVGKSSLVLRYCMNSFVEFMEPTIGSSFLTKIIPIQQERIKLQIWDTAGQEVSFKTSTRYNTIPLHINNLNLFPHHTQLIFILFSLACCWTISFPHTI